MSKTAEKLLHKLGVDLRLKTKVINEKYLSDGQQELTLENGRKIITDLFIPTSGVVPNSSYIPPEYLNSEGFVMVGTHLELKGTKDVFAIGEISDTELAQYFYIEKQAGFMAKSIISMLSGNGPLSYKVSTMSKFRSLSLVLDVITLLIRHIKRSWWYSCW